MTSIDFSGLSGLRSLTHLKIYKNKALKSIDFSGLSRLNSVGGILEIFSNSALKSIDFSGLSRLNSVGRHLNIINNDALTSLDFSGLSRLNSIGGTLNIWTNDAMKSIDFSGLSGLTSIGEDLDIDHNAALTKVDFSGLSGLTSIRRNIDITHNRALTSIDFSGLSGLTSIGHNLFVWTNGALTSIDFSCMQLDDYNLSIYNNLNLKTITALPTMQVEIQKDHRFGEGFKFVDTTDACPRKATLTKPTNLALKANSTTRTGFTVTWDAVSNAAGYTATAAPTSGTSVTVTLPTASANPEAVFTELAMNTTYTVTVVATGDANYENSEASDGQSVTTLANQAPTVAIAIPDQAATVGTAFEYVFPSTSFSDADGDTLSYETQQTDGTTDSALPSWLTFTAAERKLAGTPQASDTSTLSVKVTASDGNGGSVSDTFNIVVNADTAPAFAGGTTIPDQSWTVDTEITALTLPAATGGNGTVSYELTPALPTDVILNGTTRLVSGTPTVAAAQATYTWRAKDSDSNTANADTAALTFQLTVNKATLTKPTNLALKANSTTRTGFTVTWDAVSNAAGHTATAAPTSGTSVTVTLPTAPANPEAVFTGLAMNTTYTVTVVATGDANYENSEASDGQSVTTLANQAPTVAIAIPDQAATMGTAFEYIFPSTSFSDADGDTPSYEAQQTDGTTNSALPSWLTFTAAERKLAGTPQASDTGTLKVKVTASDGNGKSISDTFDIVVLAANSSPTVGSRIPDQAAVVGQSFSYTFPSNSFSDADGDDLTYTATKPNDTALPEWLTFTNSSSTPRHFSGTPQSTDTGTLSVKVTASDGNGGSVSDTFNIVVNADTAPAFAGGTTIPDQSWTVDTEITALTLPAATGGNGTMSYELTPALPTGVILNGTTRLVSGTPTVAAAQATYTWRAKDSDSNTANADTAALTFQLTVNKATLTKPTNLALKANSKTRTGFTVTWDAVSNASGYTATAAPTSGTSVTVTLPTASANPEAVFTGLAMNTTYTVTVVATGDANYENSEASDGQSVTTLANQAPTVAIAIPDQAATVGTAFEYVFPSTSFSDADGDTPSYEAQQTDGTTDSALPSWLTFTAAERKLAGTPQASDTGTLKVKVTASDGNGESISDTFDIVVLAANSSPTVGSRIPDQAAVVGQSFSYTFPSNSFSDADGDDLTYTATKPNDTALPEWLTFTNSSSTPRHFSGTPQSTDTGTLSVKVTASDGNGGSVSDTFNIVVNADTAPAFAGGTTIPDQSWTVDTEITALTLPAATGGNGTVSYELTPALPTGVILNGTTRLVSGTPTVAAAQATYTWRAKDSDSNTANADTAALTFQLTVNKATLTKPTNLALKANSTTRTGFTVTWDAVSNAVGYTATAAPTSGTSVTVTLPTAPANPEAVFTGLAMNTTYTVTVVATGDANYENSEASDGQSVTTAQENNPPSITKVKTANVGLLIGRSFTITNQESLTFNVLENYEGVATITASDPDPGDSITGYMLSGDYANLYEISSSGVLTFKTPLDYENLPAGGETLGRFTAFPVTVTVTSGAGERAMTDSIILKPKVGDESVAEERNSAPISAPRQVMVTPLSGNRLLVTWMVPAVTGPGITEYIIRFKKQSESGNPSRGFAPDDQNFFILSGLSSNTAYEVYVQAIFRPPGAGDADNASGALSSTVTRRTSSSAAPAALAAPTLTASSGQLTVDWNAPTDTGGSAITDYDLRYREKLASPNEYDTWTEIPGTSDSTATSATITGLTNGTEYEVQVRAENTVGAGPWSSAATGRPILTAVTVSFGAATYSVTEGGTVDVTVSLSADPKRSVTIPLTTTNGTGTTSSDYSVPSSVSFESSETLKTVTFTATDDSVDESDENVVLGFPPSLPEGVTASGTTSTTVTIADSDGNGDSVSNTFNIVVNADTAPAFAGGTTIPDQSWTVDTEITALTLPAATGGNGTVSYELTPALPTGVVLNGTTRVVSGTPTVAAAQATYTWRAKDSDSNTANADTAALTFQLTVNKATLTKPTNLALKANSTTRTGFTVTWDAVSNASGYTATAAPTSGTSVTVTLPTASANPEAVFTGLAMNTTYTVTVVATGDANYENSEASDGQSVTTLANQALTVAIAIPDQAATVGTAFEYVFPSTSFNGADGDTLSYEAQQTDGTTDSALPSWLTFTAAERKLAGTPQASDTGTLKVKVTASDGNGKSVSGTFDIVVTVIASADDGKTVTADITFPPVAAPPLTEATLRYMSAPRTLTVGTTITMKARTTLTAPVAYAVTPDLPAGLTLNMTTGEISGKPTTMNPDAVTVTVTASADDGETATADITFPPVTAPPLTEERRDEVNTEILPSIINQVAQNQVSVITGRSEFISPGLNRENLSMEEVATDVADYLFSHHQDIQANGFDWRQALSGNNFSFALAGSGAPQGSMDNGELSSSSAGPLSFWGAIDYSSLQDNIETISLDGDTLSFNFGIDKELTSDLVLGILLSIDNSEFELTGGFTGTYEVDLSTLNPYIS